MSATRIHATTVAIDGHGVMILGPSGAGKSDLALRLIDRGAVLVSDDYTECAVRDGKLIASPPDTIAGKIELRGIGIVTMPYLSTAPVALAIRLGGPVERMPEPRSEQVSGIDLPAFSFAAFEDSTPIKVAIALSGVVKG